MQRAQRDRARARVRRSVPGDAPRGLIARPGEFGADFRSRALPAVLFTANDYVQATRKHRRMMAEMEPRYAKCGRARRRRLRRSRQPHPGRRPRGHDLVVRVMANDYATIHRTLDRGAQGIVVPHVNTRAKTLAVVEAGKFAPLGKRGMFTSRQGLGALMRGRCVPASGVVCAGARGACFPDRCFPA